MSSSFILNQDNISKFLQFADLSECVNVKNLNHFQLHEYFYDSIHKY